MQNMYRVGDYVYFEVFPSSPYQIRRIEELTKTQLGVVEAKVVCFYRRRDLPASLLKIADQAERMDQIQSRPRKTLLSPHGDTGIGTGNKSEVNGENVDSKLLGSNYFEIEREKEQALEKSYGFAGLPRGAENLPSEKIHELRQHELFFSRQVDTLPATQIRGKCTVVILSEVETCDMYLGREDSYFYSLVYDQTNQTLLADKGRIDIGDRHQALVPDYIPGMIIDQPKDDIQENGETSSESQNADSNIDKMKELEIQATDREAVVYHPYHNLTDRDIDQFLIVARAVGTFSRALDSTSGMKLPSLHITASAASRDVTLLHAMALLHQAKYDIGQATKFLVPPPNKQHYPLDTDKVTSHNTVSLGGPVLCRDQLEEWSAAEATLFEDAIEKYGKDFHDIRMDCLPWKAIRDIVEYYYMWKTTARYVDVQKNKTNERENKLKQVYIPNYNKANPNLVGPLNQTQEPIKSSSSCESCQTDISLQWYAWGPAHLQLRLCNICWILWKKHGGLKRPHELEMYDLDGAGTDSRSGSSGNVIIQSRYSQQNPNIRTATRINGSGTLQQMESRIVQQNQQFTPKGVSTFYLYTPLETRVARRIAPRNIFNVRKSARSPFRSIESLKVKAYYYNRPITEIIKTVKQFGQGTNMITKAAIEYLTRLHQRRPPSTGPANVVGQQSLATMMIRQA